MYNFLYQKCMDAKKIMMLTLHVSHFPLKNVLIKVKNDKKSIIKAKIFVFLTMNMLPPGTLYTFFMCKSMYLVQMIVKTKVWHWIKASRRCYFHVCTYMQRMRFFLCVVRKNIAFTY